MDATAARRRDVLLAAAVIGAVALVPALAAASVAAPSTSAPTPTRGADAAPLALGPVATTAPAPLDADPLAPQVAAARRASDVSRSARGWVLPVAHYRITARFGESGPSWEFRHTGLDFQAPWGTPVRAVADAQVAAVALHPLYGRILVLRTRSGVTLWYCHLSSVAVREGQRVLAGQRVGRIGDTGNASGPHLHLEVRVADRPTDPEYYLWGKHRGRTATPPGWLPPQPITTVAGLAAQQ